MLDIKQFLYPHSIAIDIGESAIKVLDLSKDSDGNFKIEKYGIQQIPDKVIVDGNIKELEILASVLKKLLKSMNCKNKNAIIGIPNSSSVSRVIQIADGYSDAEIIDEIMLEADRYIPYPIHETFFDYQIMGNSLKGRNLLDVQLVAAKMEAVNDRIEVLNLAGLKPTIVDLNKYALDRIFLGQIKNFLPEQGDGKVIAFIDLGFNYASITVFDNLEPVYNRETSFGGSQLISEIQQRYSLEYLETFYMLHQEQLPVEYRKDILEPFKETITQQVNRLLQLFSSSDDVYKDGVDMIVLTGGLAAIPELDKVVYEFLKIKTLMGDPFLNMNLNENLDMDDFLKDSKSLNVCCGLAMRNFE